MPAHAPFCGSQGTRLGRWSILSLLAPSIVAVILGCREDAGSPTGPASEPAIATTAATALALYQVSAGGEHTCGVTTDNRAYCWGNNRYGQLGNGTNTGPEICTWLSADAQTPCSTRPVPVAAGLEFRQVSAGGEGLTGHSCGVTTDYRAYCWGANYAGQLGDGTTTGRLRPVAVAGGLRFRQVEAGFLHTCGVTYPDNGAYCWGLNGYGQLGDHTTTERLRPVAVAGGHLFRQLSAGGWHTCGVTTANVAFCWGWNRYGQIGDSTEVGRRQQPSRVAGAHPFRQIDAGTYHTCAATIDSRAFCWGDGQSGQIGNGKRNLSFWPRAVAGGLLFERVTTGSSHTCGETTESRAYCWGFGSGIGDGNTTSLALTPVAVAGGLYFGQVSAGDDYTCGKTAAAVAYCWGRNDLGQLGDGTTTQRTTPVAVVGSP